MVKSKYNTTFICRNSILLVKNFHYQTLNNVYCIIIKSPKLQGNPFDFTCSYSGSYRILFLGEQSLCFYFLQIFMIVY